MWLNALLERNRQCFGERTALADDRDSVTWEQLSLRVENLAAGLIEHGVGPGDRIVICSSDRIEVIETYCALAEIGAVAVPVDPHWPARKVLAIADRLGVRGVIGDRASATDLPDVPLRLGFDTPAYGRLACGGRGLHRPLVHPDDLAVILPEGPAADRAVVFDHRALAQATLAWSAGISAATAATINAVPLHSGALPLTLAQLAEGGCLVLSSDDSPLAVLRRAERWAAERAWLSADACRGVLAAASPGSSGLRDIGYVGTSPLSEWHLALRSKGCQVTYAHRSETVAGAISVLRTGGEVGERDADDGANAGLGRIALGLSVRVLDPDGAPLPAGHVGDVCVQGDVVMRGYWNDFRRTARQLVGGWMRTGEVASLDRRGYLHRAAAPSPPDSAPDSAARLSAAARGSRR